MMKHRIFVSLSALMAVRLVHADDRCPTKELIAKAGEGDMAAQLFLAYRYRDGKGLKRDYAEAMRSAHLAADRSNAEAMDLVGWDFKRLCPSPLGTGTDWGDLIKAPEKIGVRWKLVTFTPDDAGFDNATTFVRGELDAGRPVVIDFKFTGRDYPNGEAGHTLAIAGHLAKENLYILCNPAIASPGLQLMTAEDLKRHWRSDHYGALSNGVLSRPAIAIDTPQCRNN